MDGFLSTRLCIYVAHLRLLCLMSRLLTSSLLFFLFMDFFLMSFTWINMPLFPAISVAARPRAARTIGDGNTIATATPPEIMRNDNIIFPSTLGFLFLIFFSVSQSVLDLF